MRLPKTGLMVLLLLLFNSYLLADCTKDTKLYTKSYREYNYVVATYKAPAVCINTQVLSYILKSNIEDLALEFPDKLSIILTSMDNKKAFIIKSSVTEDILTLIELSLPSPYAGTAVITTYPQPLKRFRDMLVQTPFPKKEMDVPLNRKKYMSKVFPITMVDFNKLLQYK